MKKWIFRLLLLFVGLTALGPQPFLFLNDFHQQETIGAVPLGMTDQFEVEWVHSVELTPWRETYSVHWLYGMELAETSFRSFGAGVPTEFADAKVTVQDGWIKVSDLHDRRESILYLITRDDYVLRVSGQQWKLSDVLPLGTSLELSVKWFPWWYRFVYKLEKKGSDE
ncbi:MULTISPECIES: DUF1850 domain-containing protein [Brevibacillus]|jgi:hypothetical protein|uniref:DUF1850 domain-containing protein n=1 Tax=Brevibacillus borstelensis AK1 TaxID=1300222 RepID=M8DFD3_9BACL|nr:DUF1850 domain-containing protein [Brevibacillus borstelensis]EMT52178.1 hypothetical protein I532_11014 [Brevibacillus borstelensis AK1]MBE5396865.1 DUF1850 domain-containing protein [Brevibacillus borstelensis]MCC0566522.1 DUF1850 domain-containing protein [Brevibacillus borstelensis]MCM3470916.1 DUF1850 domain-containing protein [Brevibacillus borstelensis]MCM3561404.1 DUF1850 domain-containing protein [Brevibacillus borstelensis]